MSARRRGGNSQPDLFPRSKRPAISLPDNHPMVVLTDTVDWTEMESQAEKVRAKKLKNAAGRPPNLRATLGALTLMAIRRVTYREAEEQIRYYAPARYLCGLTETDWTPDFTTIQDFAQLLGEDGCRLINEAVVKQAVALGLADPKVAVADMTAQEAGIPHPNEMGLLGGFVKSVAAAAKRAGQGFQSFLDKVHGKLRAAKQHIRKYRLFGKDKAKAAKDRMVAQMTKVIEGVNQDLGKATASVVAQGQRLRGRAVAARRSTSASGVKQAATSGAKCVMAVAAQREARSPTAEHEAMDVALETGQADQNGGLQRSIWNPKTPPFPAAGY